jgi:hypothetical protein
MLNGDTNAIQPLFAGGPQRPGFRNLPQRIVQQLRDATEGYGMIERRAR